MEPDETKQVNVPLVGILLELSDLKSWVDTLSYDTGDSSEVVSASL